MAGNLLEEREPAQFVPSAAIWIADEREAWVEAKVLSQNGDQVLVRVGHDPKSPEITVSASACFAKEDTNKGVDDMTKLAYLHEPGVLDNLYRRYMLNQIYTYTGSILIAVNPFARIPGLYDSAMKSLYQGARLGELAPHVFAIADQAYRAMREDECSQSILISGESGAGKTETTKLVMEYLAAVGGRTSTDSRSVESQVLESNPILEAFGNAKTVRNNNSSRFGKFIEIQFDKKGRVSGAAIKSYLLERSRVVTINDPERNYHCFYQLCDGASAEEVEMYKLPGTSRRAQLFHYLNQSACFDLEGDSNAAEYANTRRAMDVLGFTPEEKKNVWAIVAAILHLGNIEFEDVGDGEPLPLKKGPSAKHLFCAAELLSCDKEALEESLCTITRKVVGEKIPLKSPVNAKTAVSRRDSLSKNLYSTLFDWIVAKVNASIGVDESAEVSIGVLDIYGFEHFKVNSFEQFCINLANEKLQQHFNQHVLKMEQEEYEREEIKWSRIPFADNQDILDLIEKDHGILSMLDSACKLQTYTPEGFARSLYNRVGSHARFSTTKFSKTDFTLEHYAGKVKYSLDEFLSKNVDAVVPEHHVLLSKSLNPFISALFPEEKLAAKQNKFVSLGSAFKAQLTELMNQLSQTEPHYIRCVKPNSKLKPKLFEKQLVMSQLRSGGVLEAVRMCSAGYPTRRTFEDFLDRFTLLAPMELDFSLDERENVVRLLEKTKLSNYQVGLSKVFLRAGQMVLLETLRLETMNDAARRLQRGTRLLLFRRHRHRAALLLQTQIRGFWGRRRILNLRRVLAVVMVQKFVRKWQSERAFRRLKQATIYCQSIVRMRIAMRRYQAMRLDNAATKIQSVWRGYRVRRPLKELRRFVKGYIARKTLAKLIKAAAMRNDLRLQADEALRKASHAQSQVLAGSLRFMVMQRLREKAERAKQAALQQLGASQREVEELRSALTKREEEVAMLQGALKDARRQAAKAAEVVEKVIGEPVLNPVKPSLQNSPARISTPSSPAVGTTSPSLQQLPEDTPNPSNEPLSLLPPAAILLPPGPSSSETTPLSSPSVSPAKKDFRRWSSVQSRSSSRPLPPPIKSHEAETLNSKSSRTSSAVDTQVFDKLLVGMQKEVEQSQRLKAEIQALRERKREAEERAEEAVREVKEVKGAKAAIEEQLYSKDKEIHDLEGRISGLQEKLAGKDVLEQEVKVLRNRLLALRSVNRPQLPHNVMLEVLLKEIGEDKNLGFSPSGHPVAAVIVFKALLHWGTFEAEKTNTFDQVVETFQSAYRDGNTAVQSYWLSNTVVLYQLARGYRPKPKQSAGVFFFQRHEEEPEEHTSAMVFKVQLGISMNNLYLAIRDNIKAELQLLITGPTPGTKSEREASLPRAATLARRQGGGYWAGLLLTLNQLFETLHHNHVAPLLIYSLLKQLLAFINVKIFNSLVVKSQWCPCTYSNGEAMRVGLSRVVEWLQHAQDRLAEALGPDTPLLMDELCHLGDSVALLLCEHKPQCSVEYLRELCPNLSMNQLVHLCLWYTDDKYGTRGIDSDVMTQMWALMLEDSPLLLREDEGIPFDLDQLLTTLKPVNITEVDPPTELLQDGSFLFLLSQEEADSAAPSRALSARSSLWPDPVLGFFGQQTTPGAKRADSPNQEKRWR